LTIVIGRQEAQLLSSLHQYFVVDQLFQDAQAQAVALLLARFLRGVGSLIFVYFVDSVRSIL